MDESHWTCRCLKMSIRGLDCFLATQHWELWKCQTLVGICTALRLKWDTFVNKKKKSRQLKDIFKSELQQQTRVKNNVLHSEMRNVWLSSEIKGLTERQAAISTAGVGLLMYLCCSRLRSSRWRRSWAGEPLPRPSPSHTQEDFPFWCRIRAGFVSVFSQECSSAFQLGSSCVY